MIEESAKEEEFKRMNYLQPYLQINHRVRYVKNGQPSCTIEAKVFELKLTSDTNMKRCAVVTDPTSS